jgi:hypothetical protein
LKEVLFVKRAICLFVTLVMLMSLCTIPAFAVEPVDKTAVMYAEHFTKGDSVGVLLPDANKARLNPANALGEFDAVQSDGVAANEKFYAVASNEWTSYTFDGNFMNVDGAPDVSFCEVTWGSVWHAEAVKVYLSGAYVRDEDGKVVAYEGNDDGYGYYAGMAWNKVGINGLSAEKRNEVAEGYLPDEVKRSFEANTFSQDGNFGWAQFYLPDEVVYAEDITLIDVTADVYDKAGTSSTYTGNTDGYDLDAIRVYKYIPWRFNDSATGCSEDDGTGSCILPKGTWFMYNEFAGESQTFDIQAGNPKDGENIIGTYTVEKTGDNTYIVDYDIDETIKMNGYKYDIVITAEHLAVSDTAFTSANPGKLDNQDFGVEFEDTDGKFFVFAHFAVEYK